MDAPDARWRRVAYSMGAGALYDLAFAAAILFFPGPAAALLGLSLPADPVYLQLNGVLLVLLAGLYSLPARAPLRYRGVAWIAVAGRFLGFLFFVRVWIGGHPPVFLALGLGDLGFSLLHGVLLLAARGSGSAANA